MTDKLKPTAEQIQRACDLANRGGARPAYRASDYSASATPTLTALADTFAELDAKDAVIADTFAELDAKDAVIADTIARAEKAEADLRRVDEIAVQGEGLWHETAQKAIAAIVAPYRAETDPLEAAAIEVVLSDAVARTENQIKAIREGRAGQDKIAIAKAGIQHGIELAKRGVTVGGGA